MYASGVCADYRYIFDHSKPPHYDGIILQIMAQNTYSVAQTTSIDSDLYGILLIPEKGKNLLSERQKILSEKLVISHPIIYEEERCQYCSSFSRSLSAYNKQANLLRSESPNDSDLEDQDNMNIEDIEPDIEVLDDTEKQSKTKDKDIMKAEILEKIRDTNQKYSKHRATHDSLTLKHIEIIEGTFDRLKN